MALDGGILSGVASLDRNDEVDVFVGLDVGQGEHHALACNRAVKRLFDKALPNEERRPRGVLDQLWTRGAVVLVVAQPATIGALSISAETARTMPRTLRSIKVADEQVAALYRAIASRWARDGNADEVRTFVVHRVAHAACLNFASHFST